MMGNRDGSQINLFGLNFVARRLVWANDLRLAGVFHGPAQGVDVSLGFNADGSAQSVPCQHVHRSAVAGALLDRVEHGHDVVAGLRVLEHAVQEAHGSVLVFSGAKMVAKGHGFSTSGRCLKLFLKFEQRDGVKTK